MASKAWDSSLRLPGSDRGTPDCGRRNCRDVGPLSGGGSELPGLRNFIDVPAQPIRPNAFGSAGQRQHRQAATVGSTVPVHAHVLPKADV